MTPIRNSLLLVALALATTFATTCSKEENWVCECEMDEDCPFSLSVRTAFTTKPLFSRLQLLNFSSLVFKIS